MPQSIQHDLHDEFARALAGLCPLERVRAIESSDAEDLAASTWRDVDALGYVDALTPADLGGAGLSLADAEGLLRAAGAAALPYPLADTMLARALLRIAGQEIPAGPIALAEALPGPGGLRCAQTPGAGLAGSFLVQRDGCLLLVAAPDASVPGLFRQRASAAPGWTESPRIIGRVALADDAVQAWRNAAGAAEMAGAMQAVLERCLAFVGERHQFGRALGRFQAGGVDRDGRAPGVRRRRDVSRRVPGRLRKAARMRGRSGRLLPRACDSRRDRDNGRTGLGPLHHAIARMASRRHERKRLRRPDRTAVARQQLRDGAGLRAQSHARLGRGQLEGHAFF
jgi:hypothetical protein